MIARLLLGLLLSVFLLACGLPQGAERGDGTVPIKLSRSNPTKLAKNHLLQVNELRNAKGLSPLTLSAPLMAAAQTHAQDMSVQQRPWHFGSDGSTPLDRVKNAGYAGQFRGENIAETFEDDAFTLRAWLEEPLTSKTILDPDARELGLGYYQEKSGKIWWVQLFGA